jgi:hypothetical protein
MPVSIPEPTKKRSGSSLWVIAAILIAIGLGIWAAMRFTQATNATAVPALKPPGGTYSKAQSVTISDATPNAVIHFTTDGSPPTEASPIYFLPISSLPSGAVVRAMATADGHTPSSDITGVYIWSGAAQSAVTPPPTAPTAAGISAYDQGKSAYDRKDYASARKLFAQACDGGELRGCNYLGFIYAKGLGVQSDEVAAGKIYQKACDQGSLTSCAGLGSTYQDLGNGEEARKYFKKACDGGLIEACDLLRGAQ